MVYATRRITDRILPVLTVVHESDGSWNFLDGNDVAGPEEIALIHMGEMAAIDPSVLSLTGLREGFRATRSGPDTPFVGAH
jgi:hypothetical protein